MSNIIILVVLGLVVLYAIGVYNALVKLRMMCRNAWSDIDVYLKKRHDLIPNLVNTVKGYAKHESETLEKVIQARNAAVSAGSVKEQIGAESALSGMIPKIFALAEQYPDLKANQNFIDLQNNLSQLEDDLANARRYYNAVVRDYNIKTEMFPSSLVANAFSFEDFPFFEVDEGEKAVPQVQF